MSHSEILARAAVQLSGKEPKKLAFFHSAAAGGVTLLVSLLSLLLTKSMDSTAGISGLETRTALSFFKTLVMAATVLALPFWDLGYRKVAVLYAQGQSPDKKSLLGGFARLFPALRLILIRSAAVLALGFLTLQASTMLFMLSPLSTGFLTQADALITAGTEMTEAMMDSLLPSLLPVYVFWGVVFLGVLIPLFYRFRLADLALMAGAPGAFAALGASSRATKGRKMQLFYLDLHFWWFYLLELVCILVSYLDLALPYLGVILNETLAFWLFTVLGQLGHIALFTLAAPKLHTSYALFLQGKEA